MVKKAWIIHRRKNATDKRITFVIKARICHSRDNTRVRFLVDPGKDLARITYSIYGSNQYHPTSVNASQRIRGQANNNKFVYRCVL